MRKVGTIDRYEEKRNEEEVKRERARNAKYVCVHVRVCVRARVRAHARVCICKEQEG